MTSLHKRTYLLALTLLEIRELGDELPFTISSVLGNRQLGGLIQAGPDVSVIISILFPQNLLQILIGNLSIIMG